MTMISTFYLLVFVVLITLLLILPRFDKSLPAGVTNVPSGPKGLPIIGNLLDLPPYHLWLKFKEWGDVYGPIYRLNLAGQNHVIVSNEKIAVDLLVKRGNIYSSRGGLIALSQYLLDDQGIISQPYNDRLRRWRKFFHDAGHREALGEYKSVQWSESIRFVSELVDRPKDYERSMHRFTHALTFRLAINKPVETGQEKYVLRSQETLHAIERVGKPGAYLVDILPILRYVPEFLAPWKKELRELQENMFRGSDENFLAAKADFERMGNNAPKSWINDLLANQHKYNFSHNEARMVIDTIIGAGAGTTAAALMSMILAMVLHPEWQVKAQQEIDVVAVDRVPTSDDTPELPTIRAIVKETLRWRPVTAGGVPHMSTKDDVYEGMFIPAGTQVHANQWAIHRDESLYPDPERFNPERWLSSGYPTFQSPLSEYPNLNQFSAFGFGRRICPGLSFAEQSLYIATTLLLWACSLSKDIDSTTGEEIPVPEYDYTTEGFNAQPKPFRFAVRWRDEAKARLINEAMNVTKHAEGSRQS